MHKNQRQLHPPRLAEWLVRRMFPDGGSYTTAGDLDEVHQYLAEKSGRFCANVWYWSQLLFALPHCLKHVVYWRIVMIHNYLKITWRNVKRNKVYSFVNMSGLTMGMVCCILILVYIMHEVSYDGFHEKAGDIYRVAIHGHVGGNPIDWATCAAPAGPAMVQDFSEIIAAVRIDFSGETMFSYEDKRFFESWFLYVDHSFFDVFSFQFLKGDPSTALKAPFTVVLTPDIAEKYFGQEDPIGKTIKMNNKENFTVTGIVQKPPSNSHIRFDMLGSFQTLYKTVPIQVEEYIYWNYQTYLLLQKGTDHKTLEAKFDAFVEKVIGNMLRGIGGEHTWTLEPLTKIHLYSPLENELGPNGDIRYIYSFMTIALFILTIACINFVNLSTAHSAKRSKEVGLRKMLGAGRIGLAHQFLGESLLFAVASLLASIVIVRFVWPYFNNLIGLDIHLNALVIHWLLIGLGVLLLFVGLAAGVYPAFYLSRFRPVDVLKGDVRQGLRYSRLRGILVVSQFSITIALLIGTRIVLNQLNYMRNERLGFHKDQMLVIKVQDEDTRYRINTLKQEMLAIDGVLGASSSLLVPGEEYFTMMTCFPEGFGRGFVMANFDVDDHFLDVYGIELVEGRGFSKEMMTDVHEAALVNETAVKKLGWENPIGKRIMDRVNPTKPKIRTVVGVFKDIHIQSLHHVIEPTLIDYNPDSAGRLTLKLKSQNILQTMALIKEKWSGIAPNHPFDYFFLDSFYNALYRTEEKLGYIFQVFTVLAIFIGCLGLFGLISYTTEQRTKEIGIRKVLGSPVQSIVVLLCKEFVRLLLIANAIAWPLAYFAVSRWLQHFPFRVGLSIRVFIMAGITALGIASLTVSYRAIHAARANPVDALRYE